MDETIRTHTIAILVANKPGVLSRISAVFARRGFNIESLVVSPALDGRFSRMTITATGQATILEQIIKQVQKLVDIVHASEHKKGDTIEKELILIKIKTNPEKRTEILQVIQHFKAQTVDLSEKAVVIQATGNTEKIDALTKMLSIYGILEVVRTGKVIMARGETTT